MSTVRRFGGSLIALGVVVILVVVGLVYFLGRSAGYTVNLVFPSATNLNTGGLVQVQGFTVGHVKHLSVNNGQAVVQVSIDKTVAPLHSGTTAAIDYKSLLGERYVEITPGRAKTVIPSGGLITNGAGNSVVPRVELQSILNTLDPTTRSQLASLIPQFQQIFQGQNTQNTQETLQSAGPTVDALAKVLEAVGADGQTLHQLVSDMAGLSTRLVNKQDSLVSTVSGLDTAMSALAQETTSLSEGINQLPATLTQAQGTLAMVPQTTAAAVPLLGDLQTATNQLPAFSTKLEPVLQELQPVSAELVPTLNGLSNLLAYTPGLVNTVNSVVPAATRAVSGLTPAVSFLRPYSPELAGILTNWGTWLASYNQLGHQVPVPATFGVTSLNNVPVINSILPSLQGTVQTVNSTRGPGQLPGGSSTDAAGNPLQ